MRFFRDYSAQSADLSNRVLLAMIKAQSHVYLYRASITA